MRLSKRNILLLFLIFAISLSIWFIKLANRENKAFVNLHTDTNKNTQFVVNGIPSSFESLVFVIFLEEEVDKICIEKVRAFIGVSFLFYL